jgi:hypothetical protein
MIYNTLNEEEKRYAQQHHAVVVKGKQRGFNIHEAVNTKVTAGGVPLNTAPACLAHVEL